MAVISMFYGLIVSMYYLDNRRHHTAHIHVKFQEKEAVFAIETGEVLEGELPVNKRRLVEAWIEIHKEELMANWSLAVAGQTVFTIEPLR